MIAKTTASLQMPIAFLVLSSLSVLAQGGTTGRIAETIKDAKGAVIAGAEITVVSRATGEARRVIADTTGSYTVPLLPPGTYRVTVKASGFKQAFFDNVQVNITQTLFVNALLEVGDLKESVTISSAGPLIQTDGPVRGRVVDSRAVSELPLATRNFTQILGLSPGTSLDLPDNTAVGRNSQNISVNGARTTQNNYQINGVDANNIRNNNAVRLAVPAPETIQEFKVQTSLYDAAFGRSGGGNIQAVTKRGANDFHGAAYEYFLNDALNANNPFLKAAGARRPALKRNIFGGLLGGPVKRDKAFFFISYQATRERNGASDNSLSQSVLVDPRLTDDRSELTLRRTFNLTSINPIALALLNAKLPNGQFLMPTPQANGRYSGSAQSSYQEDQFNTNVDYRISERNWLAMKFFFSNAPQMPALFDGPNVPGFPADQENDNRLISIQDIHTFSATVINEARVGYNFIRQRSSPVEPVKDSDVGISRANANTLPGLPLIRVAPNAGGIVFGTSTVNIDLQFTAPSTTVGDTLSITRGNHSIRTGAELVYYQNNIRTPQASRGQIDFISFNDFLNGAPNQSIFGTGINYRSLRTTDYSFFVQDDWKVSPGWTLNFGLRYELDLPPYDTRGRITNFDPALYKPRLAVNSNGNPVGPPIGGFVQAGNVIPEYDREDVPNVSKRVVRSVDPNNFAPRIGFAYTPRDTGRLVVRGGYGIFYSRVSTLYLAQGILLPPNYIIGRRTNPPFAAPFFASPTVDKFPIFVSGIDLLGSYTYAKSIDNASGGSAATGGGIDFATILGNQLDNRANRGVSDFDRTHRFVVSYLWDLPRPALAARSSAGRLLFANWQVAGIIVAMSGLPIDIVDSNAGSFYLGQNNALSRPSWAPGATRGTATSNVPPGYFFNPFAFVRPTVLASRIIPSSNGSATASATGTDFGNVGRNVLRGPRQTNVDFSLFKRFPFGESKNIELRAEFFNLLNHVNLANPISNLNALQSSGGSIDPDTGRIINPGDFGRITSTSNNPRLIQFAVKVNY
jgi:hypothetical protein